MPSARRTEAPPVSPANNDGGDGWLSGLLNRTDGGGHSSRSAAARKARPIRWSRCRSTSAG